MFDLTDMFCRFKCSLIRLIDKYFIVLIAFKFKRRKWDSNPQGHKDISLED